MHPPLTPFNNPHCVQQIKDLKTCHEENRISKFWGVCNEQKDALDKCFRQQKKLKTALNLDRARKEQSRLAEKLAAGREASTAGQ
mmetsp:Transcript_29345/g.40543  ORF Transcript_29345/g.40543 Transcript_29345/m.40543 type:complete len:85 (+) Transcript_29345:94-348(+)